MTPPVIRFDEGSLTRAKSVVEGSGLIVYPTDTVYGLGCDPFDNAAMQRLFEAKRREARPVPILCAGVESAMELIELDQKARKLALDYWPGPLTIVAPLKKALPFPLHQGTGTLGVRVPASFLCIRLIQACGGLLTGTSANISGAPSSRTAEEALRQLGDSVDLVLDGGRLEGPESTVVRVVRGRVEVLREGPVRVRDETKGR